MRRRAKLLRGEGTGPVLLVALRAGCQLLGWRQSPAHGAGAGWVPGDGGGAALPCSSAPTPVRLPSPPEVGLDPWVQGMISRAELGAGVSSGLCLHQDLQCSARGAFHVGNECQN